MSLSLVERLTARKKLPAEIRVEFFPETALAHYCKEVLGQESPDIGSLTDEQKKDAKERFCELVFYFNNMAPTDARGSQLKYTQLVTAGDMVGVVDFVQAKMRGLFKRAEHSPKDGGERLEITKQIFDVLLGEMKAGEVIHLYTEYNLAVNKALEQAAKNAPTAALNG